MTMNPAPSLYSNRIYRLSLIKNQNKDVKDVSMLAIQKIIEQINRKEGAG